MGNIGNGTNSSLYAPAPGAQLDAPAFFLAVAARLAPLELERLQGDMMGLLAALTQRYTGGESSSVPVETAQSLLQSLTYTLGIRLKACPTWEEALALLATGSAEQLAEEGRADLRLRVKAASAHLAQVQALAPATRLIAYRDTVFGGLDGFFTAYDPDFSAHESSGAYMDYPLAGPQPLGTGIEWMETVLDRLEAENRFCQAYDPQAVHRLLLGHSPGYRHLLLNLFDAVLQGAVGSLLAGRPPLALEAGDLPVLRSRLLLLSPRERRQLVEMAAAQLPTGGNLQVEAAVAAGAGRMASLLEDTLRRDALQDLWVIPGEETPPESRFVDSASMDDQAFRQLVAELAECHQAGERLALVQARVHSVADVTDLLDSRCLGPKELAALLGTMGDGELALLLGSFTTGLTEPEEDARQGWHRFLCRFLARQPGERQAHILSLCADL